MPHILGKLLRTNAADSGFEGKDPGSKQNKKKLYRRPFKCLGSKEFVSLIRLCLFPNRPFDIQRLTFVILPLLAFPWLRSRRYEHPTTPICLYTKSNPPLGLDPVQSARRTVA